MSTGLVFLLKSCSFILKGRITEGNGETVKERELLSAGSLLNWLQRLELEQADARNQELPMWNQLPPMWMQVPKHLSHPPADFPGTFSGNWITSKVVGTRTSVYKEMLAW